MAGIGIGAFALVVVLSAFNGIENLVEGLYSSFDPSIKIIPAEGKTFDTSKFPKDKIIAIGDVQYFSYSLEETALLKYRDKQSVATVKGVEDDFLKMSSMDTLMTEGKLIIEHNSQPYAVLGYGISYYLSLFVQNNFDPIKIYAPRRAASGNELNPEDAFKQMNILPSGVFSINPDFDNKYILVPLSFARELQQHTSEATSVEIGLVNEDDADEVKEQIQQILGNDFVVKTRYELNEIIFKTNNTEKWITFLILCFILVIAAFNLIGSLTMLIIDKKQDIFVLQSMGANMSDIKNIFVLEGLLISCFGGGIGLVLGALLCKAQQLFSLVKLQGVVVEAYPILMKWTDFASIIGVVIIIGFVSSYLPVKFVLKRSN